MHYQDPFVYYLNISAAIILFLLALPTLLNKREVFKVRLAYFMIFFSVIATFFINLFIFYPENEKLVPVIFFTFCIPHLFAPLVYYYVKNLLGYNVTKGIYLSQIPALFSFLFGIYYVFSGEYDNAVVIKQINQGNFLIFNIINLFTLINTLIYCTKAWLFASKLQLDSGDPFYQQTRIKKAWAKEFVALIFINVLLFLLILIISHSFFDISQISLDLIVMPVFMIFVYGLVAVRSAMMYKEFEHQFVLSKIGIQKTMQEQRLSIARDLHDSLGAHLTLISSVSDQLKASASGLEEDKKLRIDSLSEYTDNALLELRNALWMLHTDEIQLSDFRNKVLNFINAAGEAKDLIRFHFDCRYSNNEVIDSNIAVNVFRVIQELINNAIKYAEATDIWIDIECNDKRMCLLVKDNGKGFDNDSEGNESYGIAGVKQRIQNLNGTYKMISNNGEGTSFQIQVSWK